MKMGWRGKIFREIPSHSLYLLSVAEGGHLLKMKELGSRCFEVSKQQSAGLKERIGGLCQGSTGVQQQQSVLGAAAIKGFS